MARGGKREGAGRKRGSGSAVPTRVVRVDVRFSEWVGSLEDLEHLLSMWERDLEGNTSPRGDKARKMLAEIREILPSISEIP